MNNLGTALQHRFERTGSVDDLNTAVEVTGEAVKSAPHDHPNRVAYLTNSGSALGLRFYRTGSRDDLNGAVEANDEAVKSTPHDHPARAMYLNNLGNVLQCRFDQTRSKDDLKRASWAMEESVKVVSAPPTIRIIAARAVAKMVQSQEVARAEQLLKIAVDLLPNTSPLSLGWSDQQYALSKFNGLASDAAAVVLECRSQPADAVRLLDSGRGVILGQRLALRNELRGIPDELAKRYKDLRSLLDPPFQPTRLIPFETPNGPTAKDLHQVARDFEILQNEIRAIKGFEDFGVPLPESELTKHSASGPIILLNVNSPRSDALIVRETGVINLPLPHLDFDGARRQVELFHSAVNEITRSVKSECPEVLLLHR